MGSKNMTQVFEQGGAALKDLALLLASYRTTLLSLGFSDEETQELVLAMQQNVMNNRGQ